MFNSSMLLWLVVQFFILILLVWVEERLLNAAYS